MTNEEFRNLQPGDVIANLTGYSYTVKENHGGEWITATREIITSTPSEWRLMLKNPREGAGCKCPIGTFSDATTQPDGTLICNGCGGRL